MRVLQEWGRKERLFPPVIFSSAGTSAVLFVLGPHCEQGLPALEPCVIFNKRSPRVRQGGDLCFPGGSIAPRLDAWLSRLLYLPFSPLSRWPYWTLWRRLNRHGARWLALLLATSLRESFEEMRLNPFGVTFLGSLPSFRLKMFDRVIYPMVGWIPRQRDFAPNWEVAKVIYIPLRNLLEPDHYALYRLRIQSPSGTSPRESMEDFPCFLHGEGDEREVLWGATFRIVMTFLELVFGFIPPAPASLPVIHGSLDKNYVNGTG